ncbi:uncharacterized protein LOC144632995 [Oculina patagonica]
MQIKDVHVIFHVLVTWFIQKSVGKHLLVAYWGQNSSGGKFPQNPEKDLKDVCAERKYDIIVIGFVVTFFGKNNKDQMPEVNFSRHCWDPASPAHPNLYKCPKIEEGIKACQQAGKKVLISLGGATGNNDLQDAQASDLAKNLWDLFLGGKGRPNIRPFGSAILDGIDLDIEDHKSGGYAQLVKSLRELEKTGGAKKYLITGAPQCPFPDASLGPKPGTALGDQGGEFDHVYVQFYNNFCHTGDQAQFYPNMDKWLQFAANAGQARDFSIAMILKNRKRSMGGGPKIFVGMPSATGGAGDPKFYRTPEEVAKIYEKLKNKPQFGGFMIWDAAWDQQNVIQGKAYSDHIADIMGRSGPGEPTPPVTTPSGGPTSPVTTPSGGTGPLTTPSAGTGPLTTPSGGTGPLTTPSAGTGPLTTPSGGTGPLTTPSAGTGPLTTPVGPTPGGTTPTSPIGPPTPPTPGEGGGGDDFCKGKQDGDYADPSNPAGYISCSGGITYRRPCTPGLVWNAEKKICDWPSNVKKYQSHDTTFQRPVQPQGLRAQKGNRIQVLKRTNERASKRTNG